MFKANDRVALKTPKPLPSGQTVKLKGFIRWVEADGRYTFQSTTPGLYEGARYVVATEDLERA